MWSASEGDSRRSYVPLLDNPRTKSDQASASTMAPDDPSSRNDNGDSPFDLLPPGSEEWGQYQVEFFGLHVASDCERVFEDVHERDNSVPYLWRPASACLNTMSVTHGANTQSWSDFHRRADERAAHFPSDSNCITIQEDVSETTHSWDAGSSSFLDGTSISASLTVSEQLTYDRTGATTMHQSSPTTCPLGPECTAEWSCLCNHGDLGANGELLEPAVRLSNLCDNIFESCENHGRGRSRYEQME
jgi:hypothetical protein